MFYSNLNSSGIRGANGEGMSLQRGKKKDGEMPYLRRRGEGKGGI